MALVAEAAVVLLSSFIVPTDIGARAGAQSHCVSGRVVELQHSALDNALPPLGAGVHAQILFRLMSGEVRALKMLKLCGLGDAKKYPLSVQPAGQLIFGTLTKDLPLPSRLWHSAVPALR